MRIYLLLFLLISTAYLQAQRNVVLIIADDLGKDYLGFYADHKDTAAVPNLRRLLAKGVKFNHNWSNPVCSPTRAGILTGRYSFRTGVGGIVGGAGGSNPLDVNEMTIPRMLNLFQPNGIAKANIGKWHLQNSTPVSNLMNPNIMGYDQFQGPFTGAIQSYTNWTKVTNGVSATVTNYATTETANDAIAFTQQNPAKPFFLWLAFNAPHTPFHLPPAGLHSYTSLSGTTQDITQKPKEYFKAMIEAMDHEIGRLFDTLQVHGQLDSTDIIFIGDNGNTLRTAQNAISTRSKETLYQNGVNTAMIISGPSVVNPGRESNALVNTVDLFATILELFGYQNWQSQIEANKPVDAQSLLPIVRNTSTNVRQWAFTEVFSLTPTAKDGKAMRNLEYKLMRFDSSGTEEFYHLASDPEETTNLLLGTLTPDQLSNYQYLCSEMTKLVGVGNFCTTTVGMNDAEPPVATTFGPNPFTKHIYVQNAPPDAFFELANSLGQVLYSGKHIEQVDFSALLPGHYFMKINGKYAEKLVKQ